MIKYVLLFFIMSLSTSCATILHGTKQLISIVTHPAGAFVHHGDHTVTTPATLDLARKKDHVITISKPGYETQAVRITATASSASLAQIILPGGLIAFGIDKATGADCELTPAKVDLMLRRQPIWKMLFKSQVPIQDNLAPKLQS